MGRVNDSKRIGKDTFEPDSAEDPVNPTIAVKSDEKVKKEIWLPEPSGKLACTLLFRHGGTIMVEGSVEDVNVTLDHAVDWNEQAVFTNPYFGTPIVIRHPEEVMVVNSDWADLEALKIQRDQAKFQQEQAKAVMMEHRKQLGRS